MNIKLRNYWTEDTNKTDIISWLEEELDRLTTTEFEEVQIEVIIFPRVRGKQ